MCTVNSKYISQNLYKLYFDDIIFYWRFSVSVFICLSLNRAYECVKTSVVRILSISLCQGYDHESKMTLTLEAKDYVSDHEIH